MGVGLCFDGMGRRGRYWTDADVVWTRETSLWVYSNIDKSIVMMFCNLYDSLSGFGMHHSQQASRYGKYKMTVNYTAL